MLRRCAGICRSAYPTCAGPSASSCCCSAGVTQEEPIAAAAPGSSFWKLVRPLAVRLCLRGQSRKPILGDSATESRHSADGQTGAAAVGAVQST